MTAAGCRTRGPHGGRGHHQMIPRSETLSHQQQPQSLKQVLKSCGNHGADTCMLHRSSDCSQHPTASPRAAGRIKAPGYPSPISLSIFHLTRSRSSPTRRATRIAEAISKHAAAGERRAVLFTQL